MGISTSPPTLGLPRVGGKPIRTNDRGGKAFRGLLREKFSCYLVKIMKSQMWIRKHVALSVTGSLLGSRREWGLISSQGCGRAALMEERPQVLTHVAEMLTTLKPSLPLDFQLGKLKSLFKPLIIEFSVSCSLNYSDFALSPGESFTFFKMLRVSFYPMRFSNRHLFCSNKNTWS